MQKLSIYAIFIHLCGICKKYSKILENKGIKVFDKDKNALYNSCIK